MKLVPNTLLFRISFIFLLVLLLTGFVFVWITIQNADRYFVHRHQRLNASIAEAMVKEVDPFEQGVIRKDALHQIMHSMMAVNPAVEVYLLDPNGKILEYVVPYKTVKLEKVSLMPIHEFLETKGEKTVWGEDPKEPGVNQVFSAAPVMEDEMLVGYVYIILASEEYATVEKYLREDYLVQLGGQNMLAALVAAFIIGWIAFWLLTRNQRKMISAVRKFKEGDLKARIPENQPGEWKELASTFNEMAEFAESEMEKKETLDKLRRELIANVSHDLRTPLSVIHGYAETLWMKKDSLPQEEQQLYVKQVLANVVKLEKLVQELFELSKLEAQQVKPQMEVFPVCELAQDIAHKYQLFAQEKKIVLQANIPTDRAVVKADIALIERVLQNLLDNAIKFTPEGGTVSVQIKKVGNNAKIEISDTGVGISQKDLPLIFDRYRRSERESSIKRGGTGLGLAIVRKILELHETQIEVESETNKGTRFSFILPLYDVTNSNSSESETIESPESNVLFQN